MNTNIHILADLRAQFLSDDQLLFQAKSGNDRAFAELCQRYTGFLKQRIFRIVRQREDMEDMLQETFLSAYRHLHSFRGECSFATWMTRIGINTSLMLLRKRKTFLKHASDIVKQDGERLETREYRDPSLNPEQRYIADQTIEKLWSAMQRLPPSTRVVMDLYCMKGLRLKDAAAILGITEASAKSRILRGRNRLRRSLSIRPIPDRHREAHPSA